MYIYIKKILFTDVVILAKMYEKHIDSKSGLHQIQLILNSVKITGL